MATNRYVDLMKQGFMKPSAAKKPVAKRPAKRASSKLGPVIQREEYTQNVSGDELEWRNK
jgi:hypothetical protein